MIEEKGRRKRESSGRERKRWWGREREDKERKAVGGGTMSRGRREERKWTCPLGSSLIAI